MAKPQRELCYLWLTAANRGQAEEIAGALLQKHLIACVKYTDVSCQYWWEGKITDDKEVVLIMESAIDLFEEIEAEVAKLHSYDTFVLQAIPLSKVSQKARTWYDDVLYSKQ